MVKKEVYLQFGNRNKCITFESKNGSSDWNNLREVMRQSSKKDEDLQRRIQNSTIIFQKYKIKKSTGEKILVDVNEEEELEIENDADLAVVFCSLQNVSPSHQFQYDIPTQHITNVAPCSSVILDLTTDVLERNEMPIEIDSNDVDTETLSENKIEDNDMHVQDTHTNIKILQVEGMYETYDTSTHSQMINTKTVTETPGSSSKRKLPSKQKSQKVCYLNILYTYTFCCNIKCVIVYAELFHMTLMFYMLLIFI